MSYPKVVKVASTHSGFGKIRVRSDEDMADVHSLLILNKDFYTTEGLLENIASSFASRSWAHAIAASSAS